MDLNNPCFFCNVENQRKGLIAENDFAVARWDGYPASKGHALVLPKDHVISFFDLTAKQALQMFSLMREARERISKEYSPDGYNIGINDGEAAGRTIHHLHIHIIPRYVGDVDDPKGGVRHIIPGKGMY